MEGREEYLNSSVGYHSLLKGIPLYKWWKDVRIPNQSESN